MHTITLPRELFAKVMPVIASHIDETDPEWPGLGIGGPAAWAALRDKIGIAFASDDARLCLTDDEGACFVALWEVIGQDDEKFTDDEYGAVLEAVS